MNRRSFVAALCAAVVLIAQPGLRAETYTVIVKSAAALPQCPLMIPAAGMPDSASPVLKDSTGAQLPAQFVTPAVSASLRPWSRLMPGTPPRRSHWLLVAAGQIVQVA